MSATSAASARLSAAITSFVASLPDPRYNDQSLIEKHQRLVDKMVCAIGHPDETTADTWPTLAIYVRPDRTFYWAVKYANGLTFYHRCTYSQPGSVGCPVPPVEMVGPESMCAEHAAVRREENERHAAAMRAWAESPEGIAEARREMEWEARVS